MPRKEDPAHTALAIATDRALTRARKKPVNFAVTRILKKNKFSPLSIMVNQIFPLLPPEKQADVLLKLMEFLYPKIQREDASGRKKKGPGVQINTQVNVPANTAQAPQVQQPQLSLQELLELASASKKE